MRFLAQNPQLWDALAKTRNLVEGVIAPETIRLEIVADPEGGEELFCVAVKACEPEETVDLLEEFDRRWLQQVDVDVRLYLNVTIDTLDDASF